MRWRSFRLGGRFTFALLLTSGTTPDPFPAMQRKIQFHSLEEWEQRLREIQTRGRDRRDTRPGTRIGFYSLECQKKSIFFFSILAEKESLVWSDDNFKISELLNDEIYVPGLTFTIILHSRHTYTDKWGNLTKHTDQKWLCLSAAVWTSRLADD